MLIIQHIRTEWTKATRGALTPLQKPRPAEIQKLPPIEPSAGSVRHEIRALEREAFKVVALLDEISRGEWKRQQPWRKTPLD